MLMRCTLGSFLPVTLEQLARERGVLWSDKSTPCVLKGPNDQQASVRMLTRALSRRHDGQCIVRPFGSDMTTASFAMYTSSIAVLVQALSLISFSSFADYGKSFDPGEPSPED